MSNILYKICQKHENDMIWIKWQHSSIFVKNHVYIMHYFEVLLWKQIQKGGIWPLRAQRGATRQGFGWELSWRLAMNFMICYQKLMDYIPSDATRSMNTHICAIVVISRAETAPRGLHPPTHPPTGGRPRGALNPKPLSEAAQFQKFAKMWVFIDRVASEGQ